VPEIRAYSESKGQANVQRVFEGRSSGTFNHLFIKQIQDRTGGVLLA
jgi:hypothetical protein